MKFKDGTVEQANKLYRLLIEHKGQFISQEYICSRLPQYFKAVKNTAGGTDICRDIWTAVQYINYSDDFGNIVMIKNRSYKIADSKESESYYKNLRSNGIKQLVRAKFVRDKNKNIGQLCLFDFQNQAEELDEIELEKVVDLVYEQLKTNAKLGWIFKMAKYKKVKPFFKKASGKASGHPTRVHGEDNQYYYYVQFTHSNETDGKKNIKLFHNPDKTDKRRSYIRPTPFVESKKKFRKKNLNMKLSFTDKIKVFFIKMRKHK